MTRFLEEKENEDLSERFLKANTAYDLTSLLDQLKIWEQALYTRRAKL